MIVFTMPARPEPLAVLRREDPDAGLAQPVDLLVDDDAARRRP
jgi:hypothetical protein